VPKSKTLTPELLVEDLLAEVCSVFRSIERLRTQLAEAVIASTPEQARRIVRQARHDLAGPLQIALAAIEECRQLQVLLSPPGSESNGPDKVGSAK
jgi:hypothetical protein